MATSARDDLAEQGEVDAQELSKLVERLLPDGYDLEHAPRRPLEEPPTVRTGDAGTPFSKGILAVSLEGAGLERNDAFDVARSVEARLVREGRLDIERSALRDLVSDTIHATHGAQAASRYQVWRAAREDARPVVLLLAGATGAGKTSIAVEVARRLEIARVIGTDSIRQIMRLMFSSDLMPELYGSTFDVHEGLPRENDSTPDAVVTGLRGQAQKIAVGVHALIDRALQENASLVIEGANLVPGLVDLERYGDQAHVIFLLVTTLDEQGYRSRFQRRAAEARDRTAERYLGHMEEILAIQEYLLVEADHHGLPIIDNVHFDEAVLSVIRSVIGTLNKSIDLSVER